MPSDLKRIDYENIIGMNYRLTELQSVLAIEQFAKLKKVNNLRKKIQTIY